MLDLICKKDFKVQLRGYKMRKSPSQKVQKSIHLTKNLYEAIYQRASINHRTLSGEIEYMLVKQLKQELDNDKYAISLADKQKNILIE